RGQDSPEVPLRAPRSPPRSVALNAGSDSERWSAPWNLIRRSNADDVGAQADDRIGDNDGRHPDRRGGGSGGARAAFALAAGAAAICVSGDGLHPAVSRLPT